MSLDDIISFLVILATNIHHQNAGVDTTLGTIARKDALCALNKRKTVSIFSPLLNTAYVSVGTVESFTKKFIAAMSTNRESVLAAKVASNTFLCSHMPTKLWSLLWLLLVLIKLIATTKIQGERDLWTNPY